MALALSLACLGFQLLVLWQVIVTGLAGGPRDLLCASAAGVASGLALVVAHELGHALTGWAVGLLPLSATLVFVRIDRSSGRLTVALNRRLFDPAGAVYYSEARTERWRVAAMVAGGPAVNLVLGVVCLAASVAVNPGPPADIPVAARSAWRDVPLVWPGSAVVAWLNITGLIGLYLGAVNLVPGREGKLRTDGGQLLDLARARVRPPTDADESREPLFHLILLNDDTHSYGYVTGLLQSELGLPPDKAVALTYAVDRRGRAVVFTGTRAEVDARRDRVLDAGPDPALPRSTGPLQMLIEPAT